MDQENDSPVVNGLVALVAVALVIGLLAAIIALLGTRLVGLTGGSGSSGDGVAGGESLALPPLEPRELDSGLLITLAPEVSATPSASSEPLGIGESETATGKAEPSAKPDSTRRILLSAADSKVEVGEELMLSGTYRGGEGAVLGIFYNVNGGGWEEFNLDTNVYGGVFQVFVSTYKSGTIKWRVEDPSNGATSNEVTVRYED